jgi:ribonuclease HI
MKSPVYEVFIDGACRGNPGPSGIGVVAREPKGKTIFSLHNYIGETTSNMAEYRALIAALQKAKILGLKRLKIHTDSELLQRQINGQYRVKAAHLVPLYQMAVSMLSELEEYEVVHIMRDLNIHADRLANKAIDEELTKPKSKMKPFKGWRAWQPNHEHGGKGNGY